MMAVHTTDDIYPALREIIEVLRLSGLDKYAAVLAHRMTKVAWTSQTELFEELVRVLSDIEASQDAAMSATLSKQVRLLLKMLRDAI